MIRYELICDQGDRFEAWFRGSEDYERQANDGLIVCPQCGSVEVGKALMAPAVRSSKAKGEPSAAPSAEGTVRLAAGPDPSIGQAMELLRTLSKHVRENADNVGRRFAEEARKIHYREVEPRNIVGEATPAEAKALLEEGIEFHALPVLPEDQN